MRPGRLLTGSTTNESSPVVIPFRCLFCAAVDGCCPPETFLDGMNRENKLYSQSCSEGSEHAVSLPFWASLLSCVGLSHGDDGSITPSTIDLVRSATHLSS